MAAPAARVTVRIAVQSSRRLLRDTLSACLAIRPDITVVGRVAEADSILALCGLRQPDVVILDAGPRLGEIAVLVERAARGFPEAQRDRELPRCDRAGSGRRLPGRALPRSCPSRMASPLLLTLLRPRKARHARKTPGSLTDREDRDCRADSFRAQRRRDGRPARNQPAHGGEPQAQRLRETGCQQQRARRVQGRVARNAGSQREPGRRDAGQRRRGLPGTGRGVWPGGRRPSIR